MLPTARLCYRSTNWQRGAASEQQRWLPETMPTAPWQQRRCILIEVEQQPGVVKGWSRCSSSSKRRGTEQQLDFELERRRTMLCRLEEVRLLYTDDGHAVIVREAAASVVLQ